MRTHPRGYALASVFILAGILAASFLVFMTRLQSATSTTTLAIKRRQAFYVADAVARAAVDIASTALSAMPPPGADVDTPAEEEAFFAAQIADLQAVLDARRAGLAPAGYTIHSLGVSGLERRRREQLDSGPFRGMLAQVQPFTIAVEVSHTDGEKAVASMRSRVQRGTLSMFQFWTFVDGYAYIYTGAGGKMAGRLHANGNVCMGGGGGGLYAEMVTSAAGFYVNRSSGCRREFTYHEAHTLPVIATRPLTGGIDEVLACNLGDTGTRTVNGVTYDCTGLWAAGGAGGTNLGSQVDRDGPNSADGVGTDLDPSVWRAQAMNRWKGQLQDQAMGVPVLKVPTTGTPFAQAGRDASFARMPNTKNSRFLIDPMLPGESDDVRAQKFAFKADLRILNGVWYVRDPANPTRLGTPVWSDHPGHYRRRLGDDTMLESPGSLVAGVNDSSRLDVGQADLFGLLDRPRRYSYYRTAPATTTIQPPPGGVDDPNQRAVISYGVLHREVVGGRSYWRPGHLRWDSAPGQWRTTAATTARGLLHGTRSGFRDTWTQVGLYCNDGNGQRERYLDTTRVGGTRDIDVAQVGAGNANCNNNTNHDDAKRSLLFNMLPINFDVGALAAALQDASTGELGSFFVGRSFNGIVWVGSFWPGLAHGYSQSDAGAQTPVVWPFQGRQTDLRQPGPIGTDVDAAGVLPGAFVPTLVGRAINGGSDANRFNVGFNAGGIDATNGLATGDERRMRRAPFMITDANHGNVPSQRNLAYQYALPITLCSDVATEARNEMDGGDTATFDNTMNGAPFVVPACERYQARSATERDEILESVATFDTWVPPALASRKTHEVPLSARPNALRVINAHHVDRATFPRGLTIATNLPAFLLGDTNATSVPANRPADATALTSATPPDWRPFLIAADTVSVQSNNWEDWKAQWNAPIRSSSQRTSTATRYHAQFLLGWLESRDGNRDETFYITRLMEDWTSARFLRGSIVIGFASSFGGRFNWNSQSNGDSGQGEYAYDYFLDIPDNQPPGAPRFHVTATETFRRN
jgi:hypothetical protein